MPTNLPPEYFQAEKRFREAQTQAEKIACLEELISTVPRHKGTEHLLGDLRRRLSRLREESQVHKKPGLHQSAFQIEKEGAGQAILVGPTNVGKSALVAALTNAEPEVSPAPYTTWRPLPGMMPVESCHSAAGTTVTSNIQVQLVDTPPVDRDFVEPALFDLLRRADLLLLVVDLQADPLRQLTSTLALLEQHHILPDERRQSYTGAERMTFLPAILLVNKCDDASQDELFDLFCQLFEGECPLLAISAATGRNFEQLKCRVVERLDIIRVYAKPPGKPADLEAPFVLKRGSTVIDLARKIHRDFYEQLKSARVWGSSEFEGQKVPREYVLQDGDIVELRI